MLRPGMIIPFCGIWILCAILYMPGICPAYCKYSYFRLRFGDVCVWLEFSVQNWITSLNFELHFPCKLFFTTFDFSPHFNSFSFIICYIIKLCINRTEQYDRQMKLTLYYARYNQNSSHQKLSEIVILLSVL